MTIDKPPLPPRNVAELLAKLEAAVRFEERAATSHDRQEAEAATWEVRIALRAALTELLQSPNSESRTECQHADTELLWAAQLEDDEIAVTAQMATKGCCPICNPELYSAYVEAVRARRNSSEA